MALPKPPAPRTNNPQENSLGVWWEPVPGATGYVLQVRLIPEPWTNAKERRYAAEETNVVVDGLMPTSTYQFRLVVLNGEVRSPESDPGTGDTAVADCNGGKKKSSCVVA